MTRNNVKVSIITPCFNAAPFIIDTLRSVQAQSFRDIEHIIVDDGSDDGSCDIINEFASRSPGRIRCLPLQSNRGGNYARNLGLAQAEGECYMFLDADDIILPDAIGNLMEVLSSSSAGFATCRWDRLVQTRRNQWERIASEIPLPSENHDEALRDWLGGKTWVPPCALLWRREALERVGAWDDTLTMNQDGDIAMRALATGINITHSAETGALYRSHASNRLTVSHSFFRKDRLQSQIKVVDKILAILVQQNRVQLFQHALAFAYHRIASLGFQTGHVSLARECQHKGDALAGRQIVSPTRLGRVLERIIGLEHKEHLAQVAASAGFSTLGRRRIRQLQRF